MYRRYRSRPRYGYRSRFGRGRFRRYRRRFMGRPRRTRRFLMAGQRF